ncbi:MAG: bifunctional glutamate N-acetyltransferase/amino-acid acetyltransferase ArgJ [Candidatus Competibacterales bacterium]
MSAPPGAPGDEGALPLLAPIPGITLGTTAAGVRYRDRRDLVVISADPATVGAAVFTRNAFCAAPVQVARRHLATAAPRCLVINAGNANAGTGQAGVDDALQVCRTAAALAGCSPEAVLPFSTGVIGERLPVATLEAALPAAFAAREPTGWQEAAWGILTTDTRPKGQSCTVALPGGEVRLTGIAKGAGMICPDMATLLVFLATDAKGGAWLQGALERAVANSFNAITVDGDTSTNDACVLLATGQSGVDPAADQDGLTALEAALGEVCGQLARAVVRDGEGATKFIEVRVRGGRHRQECRRVAYTIAHSPLVKTAFFAADPNWGRILAAVGRAGLEGLDLAGMTIHLNDVCIVRGGGCAADYTEAAGRAVMAAPEITVGVALGRGSAEASVWTSDLSYDYVRINAEYRS